MFFTGIFLYFNFKFAHHWAAALAVAKTAQPALFSDVDMEKALAMLAEEAAGSVPAGIYFYNGQGGI